MIHHHYSLRLPVSLQTPGWPAPRLPASFVHTVHRLGVWPGRFVLWVSVAQQKIYLFRALSPRPAGEFNPGWVSKHYLLHRSFRISTSAYGVGQRFETNQTPLGLHRVAQKIGAGQPMGAVFRSRKRVGYTWQGRPGAPIVHRILWLEGLEEGFNRGGVVDTFQRYIYIHGFGDETTLGRPNSHGCIHLAAADLIPLFDLVPVGTLVYISEPAIFRRSNPALL